MSEIRDFARALRKRAEENFGKNLDKAAAYGRWLGNVGRRHNDSWLKALALVIDGEVQRLRGHYQAAWVALNEAGQLFRLAGDEVMWARTWVSRANLVLQLPNHRPALEENLPLAIGYIEADGSADLLVRLYLNVGLYRTNLGELSAGLEMLLRGHPLAVAHQHPLLANYGNALGIAYERANDLSRARDYYQEAYTEFARLNLPHFRHAVGFNMAIIDMLWGKYNSAQLLMQAAISNINIDPYRNAHVKTHLAICWFYLGNFAQATDLLDEAIAAHRTGSAGHYLAFALLTKAQVCIEVGTFLEARKSLDEAEVIFKQLNADLWLTDVSLRRALLLIAQKKAAAALHVLDQLSLLPSNYVRFRHTFLSATAQLAAGQTERAIATGQTGLPLVRQIMYARHDLNLLLGAAHNKAGNPRQALRHLAVGVALLERVQNTLGRGMRRSFINYYGRTHTLLVQVLLEQNRPQEAFAVLEQMKSYLFQRYFSTAIERRRRAETPDAEALYQQREQIRNELAPLSLDSLNSKNAAPDLTTDLDQQRRALQKQLRQLGHAIEQAEQPNQWQARPVTATAIRACMDEETCLIEFFDDGQTWWAFLLLASGLQVFRLPFKPKALTEQIESLWESITGAVAAGIRFQHPARHQQALDSGEQLGAMLLAPLLTQLAPTHKRIIIVPYGALHYVPFALLRVNARFLVEDFELVINPSASLLAREARRWPQPALVLAYNEDESLPMVNQEAEMVGQMLGAQVLKGQEATRDCLRRMPARVLHIASHARHNPMAPNQSYIQLAGEPLYADDLIRFVGDSELVTLSGCETGRGLPSGGDDVLGIGAEFLRIGAGALLSSLWKADDALTTELMALFYHHLVNGEAKSGALQKTQLEFINRRQVLHPAFWAGFQLSGDYAPISRL
jgi:CHAT domain-containing protein